MKAARKARIVISGIFLFLLILFALRFTVLRERTPARSIDEMQATQGIPVDVEVVKRGSVSRYLPLLGEVHGYKQVEIISPLSIDVTKILKREGDRVQKGDVLIRLARDRTGNAYHQFAMAKQALDNARRDYERMKNLYDEGAVSAQVLEQARLGYKNAKAQYTRALSMVDLVSPIDGIVTRMNATEGTATLQSVPLATVASTESVRVRCLVGQDEVALLKKGQKAYIHLSNAMVKEKEGRRKLDLEGRIDRVSLSADGETKLFMTEIVANNLDGLMKPGLVVGISVLVEKTEGVVKIPLDAVLRRERGNFVYLVKNRKAIFAPVKLGTKNDRAVAVTGNIDEGDTLVIRGQSKLDNGVVVKIHEISSGEEHVGD